MDVLRLATGATALVATAGAAQAPELKPRPAAVAATQRRAGIHRMTAKGFKILNGASDMTFLLLPDPSVSGRGVARTTLAAGKSATYLCGGYAAPCYARFAANGGVQNVAVLWHHVYEFEQQGRHFDLYDLTPDQ